MVPGNVMQLQVTAPVALAAAPRRCDACGFELLRGHSRVIDVPAHDRSYQFCTACLRTGRALAHFLATCPHCRELYRRRRSAAEYVRQNYRVSGRTSDYMVQLIIAAAARGT